MPYQDKQLKKEFIQVNGRTVPFGYPQFWNEDKDDWDISSKNNPLPTGDYGMTEGGVWIPKKVSDDGTTLTQLTGSNMQEIDTIIDAETIGPDSELESQTFDPSGAKFVILAVNIDVSGWFIRTQARPWGFGRIENTIFPFEVTENTGFGESFTSNNYPYTCIPIVPFTGDMQVENEIEAIEFSNKSPFTVTVWNIDQEQATVTVRALRVY